MNAIVVFDTKHGSSADVAARIAERLGEGSRLVFLGDRGAERVDLSDCELVVLGGPVYAGSWSKRAAAFARLREAELAGKKFAYFLVGMVPGDGTEAASRTLPPALADAAAASAKFGGAYRWSSLNFLERLIIKAVSGKGGDIEATDWAAVDAFADRLQA
jgi:menaquinone-dependent protoporphyrinogen oxidase